MCWGLLRYQLRKGEAVIHQGPATRSKLFLAHGGKLILTDQRLLFVSHGVNLGHSTISIELSEIVATKRSFSGTVLFPIPVPNAIKVDTQTAGYRFTVYGPGKWLERIDAVLNEQHTMKREEMKQ